MEQTLTSPACTSEPQTHSDITKTRRIRDLNDLFRRGTIEVSQALGRKYMTSGITGLGLPTCIEIGKKVMQFDDFSEDNNPFEEHDFGSFKHDGHTIFWKIDYYTPDLKHGSPDPSDPGVTSRVLTVMLASEY